MPRSLVRRIATVFVGRSMARGAQFVVFLVLGRMLGPEAFGWYGLVTATIMLAMQLGSAGLRQASAVRLGQGQDAPGVVTGNLLAVWLPLSALSTVAVVAVLGFSVPAGQGPGWAVPVATAGALAVILMQGPLLGLGRTGAFGLTDSLMPLGLLAGTGVLVLADAVTFGPVLAVLALAYALAGLVSVAMALRWGGLARPDAARVAATMRQGFAFALNVFLIMLSTRISLYLTEALVSAEAVGHLLVGQRLGDLLGEVALAAGLVLFSDTVRSDDRAGALRRTARIAAFVLWGFGALSLGVILAAGPLVRLTFGADYAQAVVVLQIAALAIGPTAAARLIYPGLAAQGRPLWGTPAILASIAVNLVLSLLLIPAMGVAGAALALALSQGVLLCGYCMVLRRRFGVPLRDCLIPSFHRSEP